MDNPLPSPRTNAAETKKPVPTPRQSVKKSIDDKTSETVSKADEHNTLSKRVSSASKQLAGDISQLMHDRKKAVIEGTRQSVRRIARRFSSASDSPHYGTTPPKNDEEAIDFFSTIRFNSPISQNENIYNNVDTDDVSISSEDDLIGLPPPTHPPPPLPSSLEESLYDAPTSASPSIVSGSSGNSASAKQRPDPYESVFPLQKSPENTNNDKQSADQYDSISASESWKFYDVISNCQSNSPPIYNNDEAIKKQTTANESVASRSCDENFNVSLRSTMNLTNSLYENHEIKTAVPKRPTKSIIVQFDPLNNVEVACKYFLLKFL